MHASVNRVVLLGTIGKHGVEVRFSTNGSPCASFVLVLAETRQDGKAHLIFQDCEVWGKKAEGIGELEPGALLVLEGKLAKRKKGEGWETIVTALDATAILTPTPASAGTN
jgi:single-stranded DNA-binding protein